MISKIILVGGCPPFDVLNLSADGPLRALRRYGGESQGQTISNGEVKSSKEGGSNIHIRCDERWAMGGVDCDPNLWAPR